MKRGGRSYYDAGHRIVQSIMPILAKAVLHRAPLTESDIGSTRRLSMSYAMECHFSKRCEPGGFRVPDESLSPQPFYQLLEILSGEGGFCDLVTALKT